MIYNDVALSDFGSSKNNLLRQLKDLQSLFLNIYNIYIYIHVIILI